MEQRRFLRLAQRAAETARSVYRLPIVPAIAAAQAALESAWGESELSREANNLFGIKAGRSWDGPTYTLPTREFDPDSGWRTVPAQFRAYESWAECFRDYGEIINTRPWFRDAAEAAVRGDPLGFLNGLLARPGREPGWATDPAYKEKVLDIARRYGLLEGPHRLQVDRLYLNGLEVEPVAVSLARTDTAGVKLYVRFKLRQGFMERLRSAWLILRGR